MERRSLRDEVLDARLRNLERQMEELLKQHPQQPKQGGLIPDCGCPTMTVCNNVACPRAMQVRS